MVNTVWFLLISIGVIYSIFTGNLGEVNNSILNDAQEAVIFSIGLIGIMSFWLGIMNILEKSGLMKKITKMLRPLMKFLFPDIPNGHPAQGSILMNFVANMFGVGNAATALGLKAMKEMDSLNKNKKVASNSMCMFLVINMSSIQLVPLTVLKIRNDCNSLNTTEIIIPALITTTISTLVGIIAIKFFEKGDLE